MDPLNGIGLTDLPKFGKDGGPPPPPPPTFASNGPATEAWQCHHKSVVCSGQSHQEAGEEGELQNLQGSQIKTRPFEFCLFCKECMHRYLIEVLTTSKLKINKFIIKQRYEPAFTTKKSTAIKQIVLKDFDDISFASNITNFLHFQQKQMASEVFKIIIIIKVFKAILP